MDVASSLPAWALLPSCLAVGLIVLSRRHPALRETWSARPAPANPKALTLDWHPVVANVARAGDLGFTTGPFTLVDTTGRRATGHGVYFSVWRRERAWKVAADAGIRTPQPVPDADFGVDPALVATSGPAPSIVSADAAASGDAAAFSAVLAGDARWHVDGRAPIVGRERIVAARAADARTLGFATKGHGVAASEDLAYSYGTFTSAGAVAGHYLHVWTRGPDGGWRLLVAVHLGAG